MAIFSHDKNVGPVGTCVGPMGSRIQNITRELGQERVDIIEWDEDPKIFIAHALSPAKISKVELNESEHSAKVLVPENQLSLAIGKEGQNVRLAAKLTGWKIDILSEEGKKEEVKKEEGPKAAKEEKEKVFRVHDLAKELGKTSKEIIEILKNMGVEVKGPRSVISEEAKKNLKEKLKGASS